GPTHERHPPARTQAAAGAQPGTAGWAQAPSRTAAGAPMLKALAINCTLKASPSPSSTDKLLAEVATALAPHGVQTEVVRAADHDIRPGVSSDEGQGDAWPQLRARIVAADILLLGTPIW